MILANVVLWAILKSKLGLAALTIRDSIDASEIIGINTFLYRASIFAISAFLAGLIGGVNVAHVLLIEPYSGFSLARTLWAINIVFLGGIGTLHGPILGALLVTTLEQWLAYFPEIYLLITGFFLLMVIIFLPSGIIGLVEKISTPKRK
jgi:branched-chain amino acid transport system permease protein